jgi:hypothetical protein
MAGEMAGEVAGEMAGEMAGSSSSSGGEPTLEGGVMMTPASEDDSSMMGAETVGPSCAQSATLSQHRNDWLLLLSLLSFLSTLIYLSRRRVTH